MKSLLKKSKDPYISLMAYRDTPLENGYSPAELLFGKKIQTTLPVVSQHLVPTLPYLVAVREREERIKKRQKKNYDFRHKVKTLQQLEPDCPVWIPDRKESGTIIKKFETPRSYVVKTPTTTVGRNRRHLIEDPSKNSREEQQEPHQLHQELQCQRTIQVITQEVDYLHHLIDWYISISY
jgi:hypothetical protein